MPVLGNPGPLLVNQLGASTDDGKDGLPKPDPTTDGLDIGKFQTTAQFGLQADLTRPIYDRMYRHVYDSFGNDRALQAHLAARAARNAGVWLNLSPAVYGHRIADSELLLLIYAATSMNIPLRFTDLLHPSGTCNACKRDYTDLRDHVSTCQCLSRMRTRRHTLLQTAWYTFGKDLGLDVSLRPPAEDYLPVDFTSDPPQPVVRPPTVKERFADLRFFSLGSKIRKLPLIHLLLDFMVGSLAVDTRPASAPYRDAVRDNRPIDINATIKRCHADKKATYARWRHNNPQTQQQAAYNTIAFNDAGAWSNDADKLATNLLRAAFPDTAVNGHLVDVDSVRTDATRDLHVNSALAIQGLNAKMWMTMHKNQAGTYKELPASDSE